MFISFTLMYFNFNFILIYLELVYISVAGEVHVGAAAGKQISKEEGN